MDRYQNFVKDLPQMALNLLGLEFSRFMLFIINCGFIVVGTSLILAPVSLKDFSVQFWYWVDVDATAIFLVIAGTIMLSVAVIGGFALVKQSVVIVNIYWLILLILLIAEINAAITTAIMQANVYIKVENNMIQSLKNNNYDSQWQMDRWDNIQKHYDCCGVHGYKDWVSLNITDGVKYYVDEYYQNYPSEMPSGDFVVIPYSCCNKFANHHSEIICKNVIHDGCAVVVNHRYIEVGFMVLGIVAVTTIILEICGLIFASLHARNIRRFKTTEEMRRQEMQHLLYNQEGTPVLTSTD